MGSDPPPKRAAALTACDRCKKHKQGCTKTRPICARCSRLGVRCTYSKSVAVDVARPATTPSHASVFPYEPPKTWDSFMIMGVDDQVSLQALEVINNIAYSGFNICSYGAIYFDTFHKSLPIVDAEDFFARFALPPDTMDAHFLVLVCSMILIAHLSTQTGPITALPVDLFPAVKSMHSVLQGTGKVSLALIQAGIMIAAYELCQALGQDAWLSIGTCARLAHVSGLHRTIKEEATGDDKLDTKRNIWWSIVVLERAIAAEYEYNSLAFASEWPDLDDILPLPADNGSPRRVSTGLVLPHMIVDGRTDIFKREFTHLSKFQSLIQATYLSGLVNSHIMANKDDSSVGDSEALDLDAALHSFCSALIPPPEHTEGRYCGAYGVRTTATLALHLHRLSVGKDKGRPELVSDSIQALRDLSRTMTLSARGPLDPADLDGRTFWTHSVFARSALIHIKYAVCDEDWASDLQALKNYLQYFAPRYKIHQNHIQEIDALLLEFTAADICPSPVIDTLDIPVFTKVDT